MSQPGHVRPTGLLPLRVSKGRLTWPLSVCTASSQENLNRVSAAEDNLVNQLSVDEGGNGTM